jgi:hypothetical protein
MQNNSFGENGLTEPLDFRLQFRHFHAEIILDEFEEVKDTDPIRLDNRPYQRTIEHKNIRVRANDAHISFVFLVSYFCYPSGNHILQNLI